MDNEEKDPASDPKIDQVDSEISVTNPWFREGLKFSFTQKLHTVLASVKPDISGSINGTISPDGASFPALSSGERRRKFVRCCWR